jgi:putative membrane protein
MPMILPADRSRIEAAIRDAEGKTVGELVTVIAKESDDYLLVPLMYAAAVAMALPVVFWAGGLLDAFLPLYLVQLAGLLVLAPLFCWRPVTMRLVPVAMQRACAGRLAREQFFTRGLQLTPERGGLLIFVSQAERYVEIIADSGIDAKVPPGAWDAIVAAFTRQVRNGKAADGFVAAVAACGALLAEHLPGDPDNPNRLPDVLIEI